MMEARKLLLALVFPLLAVPVAGAPIGVAIAPATGTFDIPLDGAELEFTVYNTGEIDSSYTLELGGAAAEFSSIEEKDITIPANRYQKVKVRIDPSREVKERDSHGLTVTANINSAGNMVTGARSAVTLSFSGVRTKPYPEQDAIEELPETPEEPSPPEKEPTPTGMVSANPAPMAEVPAAEASIPLGIALPILAGIIIGGVVLVLIKRIFY